MAQFNGFQFGHEHQTQIGADFSIDYNSNGITNKFTGAFIRGEYLDSSFIQSTSERLRQENVVGLDIKYNLYGTYSPDTVFGKTGISFIAGISDREHIDLLFPDKFFNLVFSGNKKFSGDTLNLTEVSYNLIRYQRLKFGISLTQKTDSSKYKQGATLSIIKGEQNQIIYSPRSWLYTEKNGKEIEAYMSYFSNQTDTNNYGLGAFNGIGAGLELFTTFPMGNTGSFTFHVSDIGLIYWNKKSVLAATDSNVYFDGVQVNNILNFNDSVITGFTQDSLLGGVQPLVHQRAYTTPLPITFNAYYNDSINNNWSYTLGLYHMLFVNYKPKAYARIVRNFGENFMVGAQINVGGYGRIYGGLMFAKRFGEHIDLYISTQNIEGLVLPKYTRGTSGFMNLLVHF